MLQNYIKVAIRSLLKHKGYSFINIFGLAIGLTCFILIGLFVQFELSYDKFHDKSDQIYRVVKEFPTDVLRGSRRSTATPEPLLDALQSDFPEVAYATQLAKANGLIEFGSKGFYEEGIYATPDFFKVFSFPLIEGNPETALMDPNSIIISETLARKFFGDAEAIGETLTVYTLSSESENDFKEMQVTAVVTDAPANSHFTFDYIVPTASSRELIQWFDNWGSNSYLTYAALRSDNSLASFTSNLATLAPKHLSEITFYQENPDKMGSFVPQALTDIHLHSNLNGEFAVNGDIKYIYLFSAIAILILLMACINYINLATARSITRAMEVGVRKVMGAHRSQLIGQFMSEAIVPSVLALLIAVSLVYTLLPTFSTLTAREISLTVIPYSGFFVLLLLIGLSIGMLAGSYPALMMSAFNPVSMMKKMLHHRKGKASLRNALVVVQFTVTIVLMIGTIVIQRQLNYFQGAQTGIAREQVIVIENEDRSLFDDRYRTLKQTLERNASIVGVTAAQTNPTNIDAAGFTREWEGAEEGESVTVYRSIIQPGFVDLFDLEIVEGRDFSEMMDSDVQEGMLINETLRSQLGWDTAVGKWFNFHGREARITGVLKDYNFHSFHHEIAPLALFLDEGWWFPYQRIYVKVRPENVQETVAYLEQTMAEFSPSYPFEYSFLDDVYNQMYQTESHLGSLFTYFTMLALLIACLGLLGLAALTVQQRTKEIGVRKVLGASLSDILVLLSKDYTRMVVIAFVLGAPIAYFVQSRWLEAFAHRVSVGWGTFLIAGLAVLFLSWITISFQSMRAALANPTDSLSHE